MKWGIIRIGDTVKEQKWTRKRQRPFKMTAGGSDRSDVIARENPFYQFNSRVQNLNFKTRYNSQVSL